MSEPTDPPRAVDAATLLAWKNRTCTTVHPCHWDCGDIRSAAAELLALRAAREPALAELVAAAREWREVIGGTLTVPPQAYLDVEGRLASAVDAYLASKGAPE